MAGSLTGAVALTMSHKASVRSHSPIKNLITGRIWLYAGTSVYIAVLVRILRTVKICQLQTISREDLNKFQLVNYVF